MNTTAKKKKSHNVHSPSYHPQSYTIHREKARLIALRKRKKKKVGRQGRGEEGEIKNGPNHTLLHSRHCQNTVINYKEKNKNHKKMALIRYP